MAHLKNILLGIQILSPWDKQNVLGVNTSGF
jgi:hypothetical protein